MESYFAKFPLVNYNDTLCADITRRVRLTESTRNALTLYYNYEVKNGTRADLIADAYYKDPGLDWLLWLTNDTVDPYYQWNMSDTDFDSYLTKKYGSIETAVLKIAFYRNNWYNDDNVLTPSLYENTIIQSWKKYYSPVYDQNTKIMYWKRKEEDWVMETNKIYKLYCDTTTFNVGDLISLYSDEAHRIGGGEISNIADGFLFIKNIDGAPELEQISFGFPFIGTVDPVPVDKIDLVYTAISNDEGVFWSPVTFYDIENEKNTYNRSIRILDASQVMPAMENIRKLLQV